jgi:hypothetical protein
MNDFTLYNHGSIVVLTPMTEAARSWMQDNIDVENAQMWGKGVVVEPRYVGSILDGLTVDGLTVSL